MPRPSLILLLALAAPPAAQSQAVPYTDAPATSDSATRAAGTPGHAVGPSADTTPSAGITPRPPTRWRAFRRDVVGVGALARPVLVGTVDHLRDEPEAWDDDAGGLAARIASRAGQFTVQESVRHGLAAALRQETDYYRCGCEGFFRRVGYALSSSVLEERTGGGRVVAVPRIAGNYAGELAALTWVPDRDLGDALLSGTISVAVDGMINLVRELAGGGKPR